MVAGNRVELLIDGTQVFPRLLERIRRATREIAIEMYMFHADATGELVLNELLNARARNIRVTLIYDALGSFPNTSDFFEPLVRAGGDVLEYHPIAPWGDRFHLSRRNHRKLFCIDDVVLIGGLNIAEDYSRSVNQGGFHDFALEFEGPAVAQAWAIFGNTFQRIRGASYEMHAPESRETIGTAFVQVLGNNSLYERWRLRRTLLMAISKAQTSIDIMNPYFLPATHVVSALGRATKRGVHVRVVVPEKSDVRLVDQASLIVQQRLLKRGVQVFRFPKALHAKGLIVDGRWASVGSYNLDYQSLFRNLEVVANTTDSRVTSELSELFNGDIQQSRKVVESEWKLLSVWQRLWARLLYRLRRFL